MNLKLNSLNRDLFAVSGANDIRVNTAGGKHISRNDVVSSGRLLLTEYVGGQLNLRPDTKGSFTSRLNGVNYSDFAQKTTEKTLMFCAALANQAVGKEAPASFDEVRNNMSYAKDENFLRALAAITRDVLEPTLFAVMDDVAAGNLMQWETVPFGGTKEITIASNDVFLFEDSAWGSARSASYNRLYDKTITLNPSPKTTQAKIYWYQHVVNGDIGRYYAAIVRGMWNKIYAMFIQNLTSAIGNVAYIPTGLTASGYTTDNWNAITTKVAAANNVRRDNLVAFGTVQALSRVLPTDGTGAAIVGLQYGLGEDWIRRGYIPNAAGVQLVEILPAIVPGTQNSTLDTIGFGDNIVVTAKGGYGYAPIYGGYYEGSPLTLELRPEETGDLTIDVTATAIFDMKPVFASKVGVITDVA